MSGPLIDDLLDLYQTFDQLERKSMSEWNHHNVIGLSKSHIRILRILEANGPQRPSHLAETLQITTGGVTVLMQKLIMEGYARKKANEIDRRVVRLEITELGRQVLDKAAEQMEAAVCRMFGMLSSEEVGALRGILLKMMNAEGKRK